MKIDETTYHEYVNFKLENEEFIKKLESEGSEIYYRFKHVHDVVEYLYNSLVDDSDYGEEENIIFETGYYYLLMQINELKDLLKVYYNDNFKLLNDNAKEVNLLLNIYDFQTEAMNYEDQENEKLVKLFEFDKKVISYFDKKTAIPEKLYLELDFLIAEIYEELEVDYYPLNTIFLDIAEQYNIL